MPLCNLNTVFRTIPVITARLDNTEGVNALFMPESDVGRFIAAGLFKSRSTKSDALSLALLVCRTCAKYVKRVRARVRVYMRA